jgi:hypothetical protein
MNSLVGLAPFVVALALNAHSALAREAKTKIDDLGLCYATAAFADDAVRTCEPSAKVIDAAFRKCADFEQKLQGSAEPSKGSNVGISAAEIQWTRENIKPEIENYIAKIRTESGISCH